ncbi:hypothetical protein BD289DRAFT_199224 [Coniella lustricola]|uniref:Uncharacterized protein n=1 Tax=Coniella lustricola TaxID=2025994 RepID=A0A2T3ACM5_9PEZI|nr:hypothetical protein BD289DRAFT_199224 [Coniella lustricola]
MHQDTITITTILHTNLDWLHGNVEQSHQPTQQRPAKAPLKHPPKPRGPRIVELHIAVHDCRRFIDWTADCLIGWLGGFFFACRTVRGQNIVVRVIVCCSCCVLFLALREVHQYEVDVLTLQFCTVGCMYIYICVCVFMGA